ncbi:MAG: 4Fe-4S binding protein [Synergistaceae bacterium]|jgi:ferredoxin|nr:4Fe-4S binding protein [Synergistaceae bacterium]
MASTTKGKRLGYRLFSWIRLCFALGVLLLFLRVFTSSLLRWQDLRVVLMNLQLSGALARGGAFGLAVVAGLGVAALFGRWYCSILCPFGTIQEAVHRVARRLKIGEKTGRYVSPWRIRYVLPLLAGAGFLLEIIPFFVPMDPIANFGHGVRGVFILATEVSGRREGFEAVSPLIWGNLAVFAVILSLAALRGRRFCDWCPVGTLLGLCARVAPFGMKLDRATCVSCGSCERACPMNCVESKSKTLDRDRCVLCLSCAGSCSFGALNYGFVPFLPSAEKTPALWEKRDNTERRVFLQRMGGVFIYMGGLAYLVGPALRNLRSRALDHLSDAAGFIDRVLPPGAVSRSHCSSRCIGCLACVAACPVGILRTDRTPRPQLDYTFGYCQYNCTECGRVCPTGALLPLSRDDKRRTRIALSNLTLPNCVVVAKRQSCGACAEVCPTHALRMVPLGDGSPLTIPSFDSDYCIGCGGCLNVCPAEPKAFTVTGVSPQITTPGMRPSEPSEEFSFPSPAMGDDFPF